MMKAYQRSVHPSVYSYLSWIVNLKLCTLPSARPDILKITGSFSPHLSYVDKNESLWRSNSHFYSKFSKESTDKYHKIISFWHIFLFFYSEIGVKIGFWYTACYHWNTIWWKWAFWLKERNIWNVWSSGRMNRSSRLLPASADAESPPCFCSIRHG